MLKQYSAHLGIAVKSVNNLKQLLRGGAFGQLHLAGEHSHAGAGVALHAHIGYACRVVSHKNRGKHRGFSGFGDNVLHKSAYFRLNLAGIGFSVYNCHNYSSKQR